MWGEIYGKCPKCKTGSIMEQTAWPENIYVCINCGWDSQPKVYIPSYREEGRRNNRGRPRGTRLPVGGTDNYGNERRL